MITPGKILALCYFDIFSYPLTQVELKAWQWAGGQQPDNIKPEQIKQSQGFYFLPGREGIVKVRQDRYKISDQKIIKARRIIKLFRLLPSVKMVAICNSLGYQNAREESDIDLFIITAPKKIWLTRFWLVGLLKLMRLRPYSQGGRKKDTFCLTFFLTTDSLNIEFLKIGETDIYLTYWLTQLMPLYDRGVYAEFLKANKWLRDCLPNFIPYQSSYDRKISSTHWSKFFTPLVWSGWERFLKAIQLRIMPKSLKQAANQDTRVVISDKVLKFHGADDKRGHYQKLWEQKCKQKSGI